MRYLIFVFLSLFILKADELKMPNWIIQDPDENGKYFRGSSTWYVTDDALTEKISQKGALHSAYNKVSNYFGLNIKSKFVIDKISDKNGVSSTMKKKIKIKSNQLISDMKPIKEYIEYSKDRANFKLHILLRLDKQTELKIKKEMQKDKDEFLSLKKRLIEAIDKRDFFKANNLLALAKGKRYAYIDDSLNQIEKRLKELQKSELKAILLLDKTKYLPNETISVDVSLSNEGYLYLFYDTGDNIEMLFPNKYQRDNYLRNKELICYPNDDINQLIAYEESIGLDTSIYAIASKDNLSLQRYKDDMIDGVYIFKKDNEIKDKISRCLEQNICSKTKIDFTISNQGSFEVVELVFHTTANLANNIRQYLKSKGIISRRGDKKIVFDIDKMERHSSMLGIYIVTYTIKARYFRNNQQVSVKTVEIDEDRLYETVFELINR